MIDNENEKIESGINNNTEGDDVTPYIEAMAEMKKNYVSRESYDKVQDRLSQVLKAVANGEQVEGQEQKKETNVQELRNKLFSVKRNEKMTDLEFMTTVLDLRDALIEKGERDPILPVGDQISISAANQLALENTARGLREIVNEAAGNPEVYKTLCDRRIKDHPQAKMAALKRK